MRILEYNYTFETFEDIHQLIKYLNDKHIPKENIISITRRGDEKTPYPYELIFIRKV